MARPTKEQTWIGLLSSVLIIASGFFGWDKWGPAPAAPSTSNTTNIGSTRSDQDIQAMIDKSVAASRNDHEHGGEFHN